jgi:hypothetical protein
LLRRYAGDQVSLQGRGQVVFERTPATVLAVTSSTGAFPTTGGPVITLTGLNMGQPNPAADAGIPPGDIVVQFGRNYERDSWLTCPVVARTQTSIQCVLPPGSGFHLDVYVDIGGSISYTRRLLSYSSPSVSRASAWTVRRACYNETFNYTDTDYYSYYYNETVTYSQVVCEPGNAAAVVAGGLTAPSAAVARPLLNAALAGMDVVPGTSKLWTPAAPQSLSGPAIGNVTYIALEGTNFGASVVNDAGLNILNCPALMWVARPAADTNVAPYCDQAEDFWGEGEVRATHCLQ